MKITEEFLERQGFKNLNENEWFLQIGGASHVRLRPTVGNDSWQINAFKDSTEKYGRNKDELPRDDNTKMFVGDITDTEQLKDVMIACGLTERPNWRERFPFFLVRGKKLQVYQWQGDEAIWTGYETTDYNQAMAEIKRRNIENNKIH